MTEFTFDPLSGEDYYDQRIRWANERARQLREQGIRPGETRPELPSYGDRELALQVLQSERGLDELAAFRTLEREGISAELRPEVERLRDFRRRSDQERAERARSESPAGRLLAGADAQDAERRQAERVEAGKALLRSNPEAFGIAAEMVDQLAPGEVLAVSGIEPTPNVDNDVAANAAKAAEGGTDQ